MSGLFADVEDMGHEQIVFCHDQETGLKAIIGIHDTTLGPALGGTRLWPYGSESEALHDVLRLSRGMTFKAACAGLPLGGGKAVIIGDPKMKSERLFRTFGRFVDSLHGRYITAEDVNIAVRDMDVVRRETRYVTGVSEELGGSGNPAPVTAFGVFQGMRAGVEAKLGASSLKGLRVAIQGIGSVGEHLCDLVQQDGGSLIITDVDPNKLKLVSEKHNAMVVAPDDIYAADAEVFAPCALGGVLNEKTIAQLKVHVVAGAANNQLESETAHGEMLASRDILYCPDYVINAGGLINVYNEIIGYNRKRALKQAEKIYENTKEVLEKSKALGIPPHASALKLAEERIDSARNLRTLSTLERSPLSSMHPG